MSRPPPPSQQAPSNSRNNPQVFNDSIHRSLSSNFLNSNFQSNLNQHQLNPNVLPVSLFYAKLTKVIIFIILNFNLGKRHER